MRSITLLLAALLLGGTAYIGARGAGAVPPLGAFLDPVHGAWAAATTAEHPATAQAEIEGLSGPVEIRYDRRGVPHIFARTEEDVIRGLGWAVARDRLFQLELQARAGAGTLSELVGRVAFPADSETRHLGLGRGAEHTWASIPDTAPGKRLSLAYAAGVNAWISTLTPADVPIEYKLLGRTPSRWEPINSLHMSARMAYTLSYFPDEKRRMAVQALVGRAATDAILPVAGPIQEPIQPNGQGAPRYDFHAIPAPGTPDSSVVALRGLVPSMGEDDEAMARRFASNNWAVGPTRSASHHPILAGDPHLELTLPSIWFEAHLVVPGVMDVYGVTIPGSPGIIIGFTRALAWSLTNTGADVTDFYRETVDDHDHPAKYMLDNQWKDLELREEVYRDKAGKVFRRDTVRYTHRGPLMPLGPDWVSMRWTANEPSDITTGFSLAQKEQTAGAFLDRLAAHFFVPAQNMIVADRSGNIAIRSTGHYPIRPGSGNGDVIFDGTSSASDWQGWWPVTSYPQAMNPAQGYLASANQQPIDPAVDPRYLGPDDAYEAWRALQINRLLRGDSAVTVDDMRSFQTNPGSVRADRFAPYFLAAADAKRAAGQASPSLVAADSLLRAWDRRYTAENTGSALFERSMRELTRRTWDELIPRGDTARVATPTLHVLLELLADSTSAWWDDTRTTNRVETREDILAASMEAAMDSLVKQHGPPRTRTWAWGKLGAAGVNHLLRLDGFSRRGLAINGGPGTLNPSGPRFGSSWRMVVDLGDKVRAFGTYPGGQSGNPASARYDDRLRFWQAGDLELLVAPPALDSMAPAQVRAAATLRPRGTAR